MEWVCSADVERLLGQANPRENQRMGCCGKAGGRGLRDNLLEARLRVTEKSILRACMALQPGGTQELHLSSAWGMHSLTSPHQSLLIHFLEGSLT